MKSSVDKHIQQNLTKIFHSDDMDQLDQIVTKYGVDFEINGGTLLFWAVYVNNILAVKRLLELGADPNILDSNGRSCLSIASYFGFVDIFKHLIRYGAKIDSSCIERAYHGWDGHVQEEILKVLKRYPFNNKDN